MWFSRSVVCVLSACLLAELCYPKVDYARSPNTQAHYSFPNGSVELIANRDRDGSENRLLLGVHFKIDPGWHIYWKNPGDTGLGSRVHWQVSNGLALEETRYPTPIRIESNGLVNFEYERETLLRGAVKLPAKPLFPSQILVKADVSWVLCSEECQPGSATLLLPVSTSEATAGNPPAVTTLARGEKSLPEELSSVIARVSPDKIELRAAYENGAQLSHPQFFPEDEKIVDIHLPITATRKGEYISYMIPRSGAGPLENKELRGVLVVGSASAPVAYQIDTPLLEGSSQSADVTEPAVRMLPKTADVATAIDHAQGEHV